MASYTLAAKVTPDVHSSSRNAKLTQSYAPGIHPSKFTIAFGSLQKVKRQREL